MWVFQQRLIREISAHLQRNSVVFLMGMAPFYVPSREPRVRQRLGSLILSNPIYLENTAIIAQRAK
jgi:hypothetical protein